MAASRTSEQSVHVRIDTPIDKRKAVLQTAIDAVELLKRSDNIKNIRHQKAATLLEFQNALAKVNRLAKLLRMNELPLDSEELSHVRTVDGKHVFASHVHHVKKKVMKHTEEKQKVNSLDSQLDALRRKLNTL